MLASCAINASEKVINWLTLDFPPYYILDGKDAGMGRNERLIDLLAKELPEYQHNKTIMPGSRVTQEISKKNTGYCMLSLFKTQARLHQIDFSNLPSTIGLPPAVVMAKSTADRLKLNQQSEVSLLKLIKEEGLRLGVTKNRSYGSAVDSTIRAMPSNRVFFRAGYNVVENLFNMLHLNRIDVLISYPDEHSYMAKKLRVSDEIKAFKMKEAFDVSFGYVGCSKGNKNAKLIADLDNALKQLYTQPAFYDINRYWLEPTFHPSLKHNIEQVSKTASEMIK